MDELKEFAARELALPDLQAWDVSYASEKLRQARYAYSEQELKQYFQEPRVLAGLFEVIETLFSVAIREDRAPVWHRDVRFYRIESPEGELLGQFYLDLFAREHKQGGAWQDDARTRRRIDGRLQTPVSFLTCNFSRPSGGRPALFTHTEVLTLFHEFGHGLHHMLSRVDEAAVSGIRGVEWDAV
jgi:oligopeptidase A